MIQLDTLVHDLILPGEAMPDEEKLVQTLGGAGVLKERRATYGALIDKARS